MSTIAIEEKFCFFGHPFPGELEAQNLIISS